MLDQVDIYLESILHCYSDANITDISSVESLLEIDEGWEIFQLEP